MLIQDVNFHECYGSTVYMVEIEHFKSTYGQVVASLFSKHVILKPLPVDESSKIVTDEELASQLWSLSSCLNGLRVWFLYSFKTYQISSSIHWNLFLVSSWEFRKLKAQSYTKFRSFSFKKILQYPCLLYLGNDPEWSSKRVAKTYFIYTSSTFVHSWMRKERLQYRILYSSFFQILWNLNALLSSLLPVQWYETHH